MIFFYFLSAALILITTAEWIKSEVVKEIRSLLDSRFPEGRD